MNNKTLFLFASITILLSTVVNAQSRIGLSPSIILPDGFHIPIGFEIEIQPTLKQSRWYVDTDLGINYASTSVQTEENWNVFSFDKGSPVYTDDYDYSIDQGLIQLDKTHMNKYLRIYSSIGLGYRIIDKAKNKLGASLEYTFFYQEESYVAYVFTNGQYFQPFYPSGPDERLDLVVPLYSSVFDHGINFQLLYEHLFNSVVGCNVGLEFGAFPNSINKTFGLKAGVTLQLPTPKSI